MPKPYLELKKGERKLLLFGHERSKSGNILVARGYYCEQPIRNGTHYFAEGIKVKTPQLEPGLFLEPDAEPLYLEVVNG